MVIAFAPADGFVRFDQDDPVLSHDSARSAVIEREHEMTLAIGYSTGARSNRAARIVRVKLDLDVRHRLFVPEDRPIDFSDIPGSAAAASRNSQRQQRKEQQTTSSGHGQPLPPKL